MFFAFAIIEYKKFRRPGNFFPSGEKNFLVCSSFGLGRLSFFGGEGGGAKEVNEKASTYHAVSICILLLDMLCVIVRKLVCKSVGHHRQHSQSGGLGARRLMRSPAPTMLFLFAFCY